MTDAGPKIRSVAKVVVSVGDEPWHGLLYSTTRGHQRHAFHNIDELVRSIAELIGWPLPTQGAYSDPVAARRGNRPPG